MKTRYWLDSIYSLPFGHPWINKIELKQMTLEEAVKALKGNDEDYKHELDVQFMEEIIKRKEEERKLKEEEEKRLIFPYVSAAGLTNNQLMLIASKFENNYKVKYEMKSK